ncbi:fatty acyl-CoA hydrolase precursor, medium chain-like [Mizuhopecten yessoensis]|uniref:Carboxylic ester hydrolase n=1 Tax=Mizuhopecten yessoensis TaxID=6573 RepID=A0A210QG72_MIZYE|nr:fatty acyl-CoA hydrolase precursor, medium chain-like [Mizuhopecten yessoensis]OWF47763.1 Fatty acyl-CoA hydrolase precursor, medium chain [Mizuhopecten yessoensis]
MTSQLLLFVWLQAAMIVHTSCQSFPTVSTPSGPIKGVVVPTLGKDIVQFRNIPYAKPPVGNLRFEKPLPVEPWTKMLDGTMFGPSCMQDKNIFPDMWENVENDAISEDCLQLNVYVPNTASIEAKTPVMVWIHGGGMFMGNSSSYDASFFAMKDVIVVTINYRLGIFGFMSTEDSALPGNYGLWDMIEALRWVNKNIASFGGDPKSVTIFGESAGGFAVSYLAMIPRTEGLFQRIIPQSGPAVAFMGIAPNPARVVKATGKFVECIASKDEEDIDNSVLVNCLKQKSAEELLRAQSDPGTQFFGSFSLSPVIWPAIDGELLVRSPLDSLNDPKSEESIYFRSLDMLAGTTDNEASLIPLFFQGLQEPMEFNMTDGIPTSVLCNVLAPTIAKEMFNDETVVSDLLCKEYSADNLEQQARNISILYGDAMFVSPTVQLLDFHAKGKVSPNTFQYTFTQAVNFPLLVPLFPWMEGAGHGTEIVYMFGPTGVNEMDVSLSTDEGKAFTDVLVTYWTNFAKTGTPNGDGVVPWQAFSSKGRDYMELKYQPEPGQNLYKRRMEFLLEDIPKILKNKVKTELKIDRK